MLALSISSDHALGLGTELLNYTVFH